MTAHDPIEILLAHDRWATGNVIEACDALSTDQFHQAFEIGPGSLHDTVVHIIGAMRGWTDMVMNVNPPRACLEQSRHSVSEIRTLHEQTTGEFETAARAGKLEDLLHAERGGKRYTFARGAVITHVLTHGMHHRAQCLNMLRHLGIKEEPPLSVLQWMLTTSPPDAISGS